MSCATIVVMAPDIHLDPERLHVHGRRLTGVLDGLLPMPELDTDTRGGLSRTETGSAVLVELDRALAAVDRTGHELVALTVALHDVASAAVTADREVGQDFRRIEADLR